jgi:hypothetical protein
MCECMLHAYKHEYEERITESLPTFDLLSFFLAYLCRKRLELEFGRLEKKSIKNNLENENDT